MARRVFYSFHYKPDNWRVSQVRNIGAIDGNKPASDNDWETVTKGGDKEIEKWIADQMHGRSCIVVLIGSKTAGRKWINHEIVKGWDAGKGVLGVHIHGLKDSDGDSSSKGSNLLITSHTGPVGRSFPRLLRFMTHLTQRVLTSTITSRKIWIRGSKRLSKSGIPIELGRSFVVARPRATKIHQRLWQ